MKDPFIGEDLGIYEVLKECEEREKYGHKLYRVRCKICGWEHDMRKQEILKLSPRCWHLDATGRYRRLHNDKWGNDRLGRIFKGMKRRCYWEKDQSYSIYGGKGIEICDEWLDDPNSFERWALDNGYIEGLTIDRIDPQKGYSPENCRWVSLEDNAKYKSTTRMIDNGYGEVHTGRDWSALLGLGENRINTMMRKYPEYMVREFIVERQKDKTKTRKGKQSWMDVYGIS